MNLHKNARLTPKGRDLLSARRVAGCLWWVAPPRSPRLAGGQNLRGAKHHNLCGEPLGSSGQWIAERPQVA